MDEREIRCGGCASRWPGRTPRLLATMRDGVVLVPVRIGARKAHEGGVGRTGMFWRKAAMDDTTALLRCPRCRTLTRYEVSSSTMADVARSVARPSVAT